MTFLDASGRALKVAETVTVPLPESDGFERAAHVFERRELLAINAALASQRPLLVRGEPGTGKSQLARAAAVALERAYIPFTVDARTETRDLLYTVDDVARLAEAQVQGALYAHHPEKAAAESADALDDAVRDAVKIEKFVVPGPLWWAFDWTDARRQAERAKRPEEEPQQSTRPGEPDPAPKGCVVLIDEIDKADSAIPNGLLDALGHRRFRAPGQKTVQLAKDAPSPLVVITTNEERALPDAFLRRCWVLHLALPEDQARLESWLFERGEQYFEGSGLTRADLEGAATLVATNRLRLPPQVARPGTAEYIDLLRAVRDVPASKREALLDDLAEFALDKHGHLRRNQG
ncbi:MAG: AAA family ATPase [Myxococcales bacterium]|nr:AAA family ATPase [Myxococcales bacterium]